MPHDVVPIARGLVLALFPTIAAAIRGGRVPRKACDDAWDAHGSRWRAEYGPDVAQEAAAILDALGAADVLIKSGTAAWIARGPIAGLRPVLVEASPPSPRRSAIRRLWGLFLRGRDGGPDNEGGGVAEMGAKLVPRGSTPALGSSKRHTTPVIMKSKPKIS